MKNKKFLNELLEFSPADLEKKLDELQESHFRLRCNKVTGQITDTSTLAKIKKDIARVKTIIAMK